ncbi:hypothetical protein PENNAL_c0960G08563, partial [Penicillium nalgiovense]
LVGIWPEALRSDLLGYLSLLVKRLILIECCRGKIDTIF